MNDYGKQAFAAEGKKEADILKDIPPKEIVEIPACPGSYFGMSTGTNEELSGVTLISRDDPGKVIAGYRKQLGNHWRYLPNLATAQLGEVGVFVKTDKKNVNALDSLKYKQLRISKVEKPEDTGFIAMMFDVRGIKSMIVMTLKPAM